MATIYIDDQAFEVEDGKNVLEAVLGLGLDLPYFCWHPAMGSVGACRQCALVQYRDEEDTQGRIVMGCMTPVADGARFSMQGSDASEFRKNIVESLMLNHPHDCPVCAEGGECHLQDMTVMVGHRNRSYRGRKNTHNNQNLGPLIHHEMNRCISCYRCTRYYNDYAGGTDLSAQAAHDHVYFGRHEDGTLESEFAGNLVEVCPTGVFTDKPLVNDYTRKWDLQSAPSVCTGCAVGCNIMPGERYGKLKRIHNRYNSQVNGYFLCDRGRFGGNFVNDENRALFAGQRNNEGRYDAIESDQAIEKMAESCGASKKVVGIGSPRASLESNYLLRRLVGAENFASGMADHESQLASKVLQILQSGSVSTPSIKQIESADAVLILGEDVTNTAPRMALALRQSVRNRANDMASAMNIPLWQDEAVRNLAQDELSPLFIVAMTDTPLDDIAQQKRVMTPSDIAYFGYAVAAQIDPSLSVEGELDTELLASAQHIAETLKKASRPLIVSGSGAQSIAVINAASAIAESLANSQAMLSYCLPECNTLGLSLLEKDHQLSLENICARAANGDVDSLVIVENDLYRRAPKPQIDTLLQNISEVIVLDCVDTPTLSQSGLALPTAAFLESEGTLVSSEGRAQRHYPVYLPAEQRRASWRWLVQLGQVLNKEGFSDFAHFDDVSAACAANNAALGNIREASPGAEFLDHGLKIPRQPHRYSGRTAMRADISVHEPKQPTDDDTPFKFSMEGSNTGESGALLPFTWSPGWNSNQSIHKFQSTAGGALKGGTPGIRLIEAGNTISTASAQSSAIGSDSDSGDQWQLLPHYQIFGSEELSAQSPAIKQLTKQPFIQLCPADAKKIGVNEGEFVAAKISDVSIELRVTVTPSMPAGCAAYAVGLPGAPWLAPQSSTRLVKAQARIVVESGASNV